MRKTLKAASIKFKGKHGHEIELIISEKGFSVRDSDGVYMIDASIFDDDGRIEITKYSKLFPIVRKNGMVFLEEIE